MLMAVRLDASDVAITTSSGTANLMQFTVFTDEVRETAGELSGRWPGDEFAKRQKQIPACGGQASRHPRKVRMGSG